MPGISRRLNGVRPRRPEQSVTNLVEGFGAKVSMESGLEGRNNLVVVGGEPRHGFEVSMESGLEGRNNRDLRLVGRDGHGVSMESGLEGRNNAVAGLRRIGGLKVSQWSPNGSDRKSVV